MIWGYWHGTANAWGSKTKTNETCVKEALLRSRNLEPVGETVTAIAEDNWPWMEKKKEYIYPWFSMLMWSCIIAQCKKAGQSLLSLRNSWVAKDSGIEITLYCLAVRTAGLGAKGKMAVCYESRETQYCHYSSLLTLLVNCTASLHRERSGVESISVSPLTGN